MGSIVYGGHDFSAYCQAMTIKRACPGIEPVTETILGRPGELLLSGRMRPLEVRVKLFLDLDGRKTDAELAAIRHELSGWLTAQGGTTLVLPEEPGLALEDVVVTEGGDWDRLFEDGECEIGFTAYDPIAHSEERSTAETYFMVGGNWPTWPRFEMVANGEAVIDVALDAGPKVRVEHAFAGGEKVVVDCGSRDATIDGADARADIALVSDFFSIGPEECSLHVTGASEFTVYFTENWV